MYFEIKKVTLSNWMAANISIPLSRDTTIMAKNGEGKSRIGHAIKWVLTGKNGEGKSEIAFDIKDTINTENNRLPHTVILDCLKQDGSDLQLKKDYLETWSGAKGSAEEKHTGHTVKYYIDGSPKSKSEYNDIITSMIPESLLFILSDPLAFPALNWTEQRSILEQMAGAITAETILTILEAEGQDTQPLKDIFAAGKKIEDRKQRIKLEIETKKKNKADIRPKIQENSKTIEAFEKTPETTINKEITRLNAEVIKIDDAILDKSRAADTEEEKTRDLRRSINTLKGNLLDIENRHRTDFNRESNEFTTARATAIDKVTGLQTEKKSKETLLNSTKNQQNTIEENLRGLIKRFTEENAKEFPVWDENNFICPKCHRKHEPSDVAATEEQLKADFVAKKKENLGKLNIEGAGYTKQKKDNEALIATITKALDTIKTDLEAAETALKTIDDKIAAKQEVKSVADRLEIDADYLSNKQQISEKEELLNQDSKPVDYTELRTQKANLTTLLDEQKGKLQQQKNIELLEKRNIELAEDERVLAQEIATFEREAILIRNFEIARMDLVEQRVRLNFEYITFKMFETNIGTGETKPFCEMWFDGKPYSALNTAAKLNAGLDLINGLSKHYGVFIPIILDNRESVSNIIPTKSQVINLVVPQPQRDEEGNIIPIPSGLQVIHN